VAELNAIIQRIAKDKRTKFAAGKSGQRSERRSNSQLHRQYPETLRAEDINNGLQKGLIYPWKIKPARIKSYFGIRKSQIFVKHNADRHGNRVGNASAR